MVTATILELDNQRPLTADDLRVLPDDGNRYEIIGGELYVSPSPKPLHQRVSFKLSGELYAFLDRTGLGEGFTAPADVHLSPNDVVQPDIFVVLRDNAEIVTQRGIYGAPDVAIEILSPSSLFTDVLRKSRLYERSGVREYWIVNPENEVVSVQALEGDRFAIAGEFGRNDTLRSSMLDGFELALSVLFPSETDESAQAATEETQPTNDE